HSSPRAALAVGLAWSPAARTRLHWVVGNGAFEGGSGRGWGIRDLGIPWEAVPGRTFGPAPRRLRRLQACRLDLANGLRGIEPSLARSAEAVALDHPGHSHDNASGISAWDLAIQTSIRGRSMHQESLYSPGTARG